MGTTLSSGAAGTTVTADPESHGVQLLVSLSKTLGLMSLWLWLGSHLTASIAEIVSASCGTSTSSKSCMGFCSRHHSEIESDTSEYGL